MSSRLVATSGDLQFTALTTMSMDPPRQLPDDLLLRPYPNPSNLAALHEVNTHLYSIVVCNMSKTKAHVLQDVKVKLESFVADTNTINTTHNCIRLYSRQGMIDHTGCGGGFAGGDLNLSASFASNGTIGAVASTQGMTPMTLAPGYGAYITVDVTPPSTPGTATYRLGFAFDNAGSIYPVAASAPVTNSDKMRMWDGDACLPDAMQSQVPTTNPSTPYICPQAS